MTRARRKARAHRLGGRLWTVTYTRPLAGAWGDSEADTRKIRIEPDATRDRQLDAIIHEGIHACCPVLAEEAVAQMATELKNMLCKEGFMQLNSGEGGD